MIGRQWMIYGANGYTGALIAEEAVAQGLGPILAGRNGRAVTKLATRLGCESRVFRLGDPRRTSEELVGLKAVLNCAGPFSATGEPMMDACLEAGTDYLDITGEIPVIEAAYQRHEAARRAGASFVPAVGFDVVPTDCLAATLANRLPEATTLQLAFTSLGRISGGTAATLLEILAGGGRVRTEGRLVDEPIARRTMKVPFRDGPQYAVTFPTGDLVTAWHNTGIPNIEVYVGVPALQAQQLRSARQLFRLLRYRPIRAVVRSLARRAARGPTAEQRRTGHVSIWGRVTNRQGNTAEATLEVPEAYRLTVDAAIGAIRQILDGAVSAGFHTPAGAFGSDFICELPESDLRCGW